MTKNERILIIMLNTIIDKSQKYINADFVTFPNKEIGFVKKGVTYYQKVCDKFDKTQYTHADIRTAVNRVQNQIYKMPHAEEVSKLPQEDLNYLIIMELTSRKLDEVIEKQKLSPEIKTYLKTGNTYIKKFLGYIENEIGA